MTDRTMYDSANPAGIPADAQMVAGYVPPSRYAAAWDGPQGFARFPKAQHVRITVAGTEPDARAASVVDVERGAFVPAQARNFIRERNAFRPGTATVYVQESSLTTLTIACKGLHYWVWVAWWIQVPPSPEQIAAVEALLPPGVRLAAWQYLSTEAYDVSLVVSADWHPVKP